MLSTLTDETGPARLVRAYASRALLISGKPLGLDQLASSTQLDLEPLTRTLEALGQAGRIRRAVSGRVVGSCRLSVVPDRHQISIAGRSLWTGCAYDILGIFGALNATGTALSRSPASGTPIELVFENGRPRFSRVVLFRPDDSFAACCTNTYEEWCPNSNLFEHDTADQKWQADRKIEGRVLTLSQASELASIDWAWLVSGTGVEARLKQFEDPPPGAETGGSADTHN